MNLNKLALTVVFAIGISAASILGVSALENKDAYINHEGNKWVFGTSSVERTVTLEDGKFILKSFKSKISGKVLGAGSDEFSVSVGDQRISGSSGGWKLVDSRETELKNGELQLDITLQRDPIQITKSYVMHPKSSLIREWVSIKNIGSSPVNIKEPDFFRMSIISGNSKSLDFNWMTGGECQPGSWTLKTEKLKSDKPRRFDSYEPFPLPPGVYAMDGINAKILLNDKQVWPEKGWQYVASAYDNIPFDLNLDVKTGDRLVFLVNMNHEVSCDSTTFDPTIAYDGGESHTASKEFGEDQGENGWRYEYSADGKYHDLEYNLEGKIWHVPGRDSTITFITAGIMHPGAGEDIARVWTTSKDGKVKVTGSVCNIGNYTNAKYAPRPGSGSYAPWYAIYDNDSNTGVFIGWDYFSHWDSSFNLVDGKVSAELKITQYDHDLAPGENITSPKAFIGIYQDDLDNAGNECLDWQYRYMWDYTREGWFPAIRMLGYWYNGTGWMNQQAGYQDIGSTTRKVFRTADLMRYVGGDVYHRDWGWWDKQGDWNGPDWAMTRDYLKKYDMGQLIYAPIYGADAGSWVADNHPEWFIGGLLDMSNPEVMEWLKKLMDSFSDKWAPFEWRTDGGFTTPGKGEWRLLGQDQGFREIIRYFLDQHPDCAFQACNGGGNYLGYEYVALSSCIQMTDGATGILSNYYTSLLVPADRTCHMPDMWNPDKYDKSIWRGLLSLCFDMTGDTWDPEKLELLREQIDIYHYLYKHGVVGRWVKIYRPVIEGDDLTMYFQRMSGDRKKGIIITKHQVPGAVTIKPKGLIPDMEYTISYQDGSGAPETRTGADLMTNGIYLEKVAAGELIYLNLPMHPGSKLDTEAPSAPSNVTKQWGENMGYPGVELSWEPATDNNWISYYRILRDGKEIDKVAKGSFYFDHSAGADLAASYEVIAVDGAGNVSPSAIAVGPHAVRSDVYDDTAFSFTGNWEHRENLLPAYNGTVSLSGDKGASAQVEVEGKRVLVFIRMGADCGNMAISIDSGVPEIIDTYSADDIWGACIYKKDLSPGKHTVRVEVTGDRSKRSKGTVVSLDGIRVEK
ncbi:MAG: alpha-amylase family protein [Armatimonadota bacterium]